MKFDWKREKVFWHCYVDNKFVGLVNLGWAPKQYISGVVSRGESDERPAATHRTLREAMRRVQLYAIVRELGKE